MLDTTIQQPQQVPVEQDPQQPVPPPHTQDSFNTTLDKNPGLTQAISKALADSADDEKDPDKPVPQKSGSTLGDIWNTIKGSVQGAKRGVAEGLNSASNTVLDLGKQISQNLGADNDNPLLSKEQNAQRHQDWVKWYEGKASEQNPVQIPEDKITKWFGPSQGGIPGFVEGAAQFATGLALTHKLVPDAMGPLTKVGSKVIPAVQAAARGAIADISAFDPHQQRLSNMIQNGPSWMRNPATEFLQSKDDDPMPLARLKQGAEGLLLNSTIEALTYGVKALKARMKGDPAAAAQAIEQAATVKPDPTDVAKVEKTPDGWAVLPVEKSEVNPLHTFTQGEAEQKAASINYIVANGRYIPGELDEASTQAFQERMKAYTDGTDSRSIEDLRDQYGINLNYVQSPEQVTNTIKAMVDVMPEPSAMTRNIPRSLDEIRGAATDMFKDMPADDVLAAAQRVFGNTERLPEQITAMREWMYEQAKQTRKLSQMADADPTNAVVHQQLGQALDTMLEFHAHLTGTSSSVGRALAAHAMPVGEAANEIADAAAGAGSKEGAAGLQTDAEGVGGTVEGADNGAPHRAPARPKATAGLTQAQIRALARTIYLTNSNDPAAILAAIRGPQVTAKAVATLPPSTLSKYASFVQTYRMEAMLSGPKTQFTKVMSDFMTMMQRPAEYWWAGARSGKQSLQDMGTDMYGAMFSSLRDSFSLAKKSFLSGDNILSPSNSHTGTTLGPLGQSGWLTDLLHMPSRLLMTTDEFAKQMNYRMNYTAQVLRQARDAGVTDGAQLAQRLADSKQWMFDPQGGATNPMSLQYAKENTFTQSINSDTHPFQAKLMDLINSSPAAKVIVPFVRTPLNIFNYAWERTPLLNQLNGDMKQAMSGALGADAKALAQAKTEGGMAIWGLGALLSQSGQLTGRGPSDVKLRQQWIAAGNQPYSVKIPGAGWVSYRRINPQLDAFGLIADMHQMSSDVKTDDWSDVAAAVLSSLAANVSSKTFMQGVSEFADAIGSGDPNKGEKFIKSMAGTFVPNALNQTNPDQSLRESRTLVEELASRVPGFSEDLEPRRNLMGEPILKPPGYFNDAFNPFTIAPGAKAGDVQDELVQLGKAFSMPATHRVGTLLDLTDRTTFNDGPNPNQSPYDRMLELMSSDGAGGPLRDQLERLMGTDAYQNAPAEDAEGKGGMKWRLANDIIQSKQEASWGQVLKEYPSLRQAYQASMQMQAQGQAHGKEGVQSVMDKYSDMFKK